ncbi:MAG TPA: hypothetical protein VF447_00895 [Terriglobales bacterium]
MSNLGWDLAITAAGALDADEKSAVLGDLAEAGAGGTRALWEVCGLVLRRQTQLWMDWRPWVLLFTVVAPLGFVLSIESRLTAGINSVYLWLYLNNLGTDLLHNRGFWYELGSSVPLVFGSFLRLACWSWIAGMLIGFASKRVIKSSYLALLVVLMLAFAVGAPFYLAHFDRIFLGPARIMPNMNDPISQVPFYHSLYPWLVQLVVVAVPTVYGICQSSRAAKLGGLLKLAIVILLLLASAEILLESTRLWFIWIPHPVARNIFSYLVYLAPLRWIVYWPVAYVLALKLRRQLGDRVVAS